jgi:cob(I)alamin adenosyltransferase
MKIYTKTGDDGETGLLGGVRISKSHVAVTTTGFVDETNSWIGFVRSLAIEPHVDDILTQIQHDLFDLGSRIAACLATSSKPASFPESRATELESFIDQLEEQLTPLTAFILPSGSQAGSALHLARSVCRRAECELVRLTETQLRERSQEETAKQPSPLQHELIYLNRLSDLLFVLARYVNQLEHCPETRWNVGRKGDP